MWPRGRRSRSSSERARGRPATAQTRHGQTDKGGRGSPRRRRRRAALRQSDALNARCEAVSADPPDGVRWPCRVRRDQAHRTHRYWTRRGCRRSIQDERTALESAPKANTGGERRPRLGCESGSTTSHRLPFSAIAESDGCSAGPSASARLGRRRLNLDRVYQLATPLASNRHPRTRLSRREVRPVGVTSGATWLPSLSRRGPRAGGHTPKAQRLCRRSRLAGPARSAGWLPPGQTPRA